MRGRSTVAKVQKNGRRTEHAYTSNLKKPATKTTCNEKQRKQDGLHKHTERERDKRLDTNKKTKTSCTRRTPLLMPAGVNTFSKIH